MTDKEFVRICCFASSKQIIHAIKNGANINAIDEFGSTTLMLAAINENFTMKAMKLLLDRGVDVNAKDYEGVSALMYSVQEREDSAEIAEMLLKAGADVNAKDIFDDTALHEAAHWCMNEKTIEILLDAGADAKVKNNDGKMAIDYARKNNKLKGTKVLERLEKLSI